MFSLYIHIPFCLHKCSYCDFFSLPVEEGAVPQRQYVDRLKHELAGMAERFVLTGRELRSIFFGGGTPSMMRPELLGEFLAILPQYFSVPSDIEVTCEANPETLTIERLQGLRAAGINRLSMGVQSFHPRHLKFLERVHSADRALDAARDIVRAGFANRNLDIIYGLPGQTMEECQEDIAKAIGLGPTHISAYQLTVEKGTPLATQVNAGCVIMPDDELVLAMWDAVRERLADAGYPAYEISNHACPGFECRHNLNYWEYGEYLGLGAGACSFFRLSGVDRRDPRAVDEDRRVVAGGGPPWPPAAQAMPAHGGARRQDPPNGKRDGRACYGVRFHRSRNLRRYLAGELVCENEDPITKEMAMGECAFLGLRMEKGISEARFREQFGLSPLDVFGDLFQKWESLGLLWQAAPSGMPCHRHGMPQAWHADGRGLNPFIISGLPLDGSGRRWSLTPAGRRIANTLSAELIPWPS